MKAAIYHGRERLEIEEVERPYPKPGYVLIRMEVCGVCGSDLHSYFGFWEQPPSAHGHEVSGVIVERGAGVTGFTEGDRVCMEWFSHCEACRFCATGAYNLCENLRSTAGGSHAGFAEYVIAHSSSLFKIPDLLTFPEAAMAEPLAVAYRAFRRTGARSGDSLLVIGAGTIGLLAAAAARADGVGRVIISANHDHQAAAAADLGVDAVIRPGGRSLSEQAVKMADGSGSDAVIETTASPKGVADAFAAVRKEGTVVLVGGFRGAVEVDLKRIVDDEIHVAGSFCYGYSGLRRDFDWSIDLIQSGKVPVKRLITHTFPLSEIRKAFETAADKETGSIKVQVLPGPERR